MSVGPYGAKNKGGGVLIDHIKCYLKKKETFPLRSGVAGTYRGTSPIRNGIDQNEAF